ncbi:alpha/beta hydrolase [Methylocapsa polymorpha]|uniref:Palmitoyl-protein thioesterase ABHD10, mitochondrial n=1 Tax=Methylocapsa polymorpha TaxID=3080828 RepID=A0ABZ0HT90_9HYPH|nr:alpha/beta hydrolase [Methylocapsa sp. RX1]
MKEQHRQILVAAGLEPGFVTVGEGLSGRRIAYLRRAPSAAGAARPGIVWFGGFGSDMRGLKAERLDCYAAATGRAFLRFDYSGHGCSEGGFETATIGLWLEESLAVLRRLTEGPQALVGSSMGGWLALLAARALQASGETERLKGLVLIAPAVDFTESLIWERMSPEARQDIEEKGLWLRHSPYSDEPYPITRALIEEGRRHLLLGDTIRAYCPVHVLQGMQDEDVPWRHAMALVENLAGDPVSLTLIKDGDHRLSRDQDLKKLIAAVEMIA